MTTLPPTRFTETKFSESFWSNSRGDYVTGLNVLHAKIDQGAVEDQEILTYVRERIDVEQRYGNALIEMGNRRLKVDEHRLDELCQNVERTPFAFAFVGPANERGHGTCCH